MKQINYSVEELNNLLNKIDCIDVSKIHVKDFGAVGDGITDDTAAIQNAINNCEYLIFDSGKYIISSPIYLKSNLNIVFSPTCEIFLKDNSKCIMFDTEKNQNYENIFISGGIINGNDYGQGPQSDEGLFNFSNAFRFFNVTNLQIRNMKIQEIRGHAIQHWNCNHVIFDNIEFYQNFDNETKPAGGSRRDGITGGSSNVLYRDIRGFTDDDMIAILSGVDWGGVQVEDVENIFIENINGGTRPNPEMDREQPTHSGIRIACANGYFTKNVYINNLSGNFALSPIRLGGYDTYMHGYLSNINISNINDIKMIEVGQEQWYDERGIIWMEKCKCNKLVLENINLNTSYSYKGTLLHAHNANTQELILKNINFYHDNTGANVDSSGVLIKDRANSLDEQTNPFIKNLYFNNVKYGCNHNMTFYRRQPVDIVDDDIELTYIYGDHLIYNEDCPLSESSNRISINSADINIDSYELLFYQKNGYKWSYNHIPQFISNNAWHCNARQLKNVNDFYSITSRDSVLLVTPSEDEYIRIQENQTDKFPPGFIVKIKRTDDGSNANIKKPYIRMLNDCLLDGSQYEVQLEAGIIYELMHVSDNNWIILSKN